MSKANNTANKTGGLAPLDRQQLSEPLRRLIDFFEHLTEQTVADMPRFYAGDAYFKDPFNEVNRVEDIARIFGEMFHQQNHVFLCVCRHFPSQNQFWREFSSEKHVHLEGRDSHHQYGISIYVLVQG